MKSKNLMMTLQEKKKLLNYFFSFVTSNKREKIQKIAPNRMRHVAVVTEDVSHTHNISAVIRSCECFGVQDVHIIENNYRYKVNSGVAQGAADWLDIHRYNKAGSDNTQEAYQTLKSQGYKIIATSPDPRGYELSDLPLDDKIALVFGTEQTGLSDYALQQANDFVRIPMYGFTQSFNISVSAALCLYDITKRIRRSDIKWQLSDNDLVDLKLNWLRGFISGADKIEKKYLEMNA